jgi:hypothetical protein
LFVTSPLLALILPEEVAVTSNSNLFSFSAREIENLMFCVLVVVVEVNVHGICLWNPTSIVLSRR